MTAIYLFIIGLLSVLFTLVFYYKKKNRILEEEINQKAIENDVLDYEKKAYESRFNISQNNLDQSDHDVRERMRKKNYTRKD